MKGKNIIFHHGPNSTPDFFKPCHPCTKYKTCLFNAEACKWRRDYQNDRELPFDIIEG